MKNNYGGKANSLIRLQKEGFPVPAFFVIDSFQYIHFLKANNLYEEIEKLSGTKNYIKIKQLIQSGGFDQHLKDFISKNFENLGCEKVSIRSSASNEDGESKSFAGQYNTYLDVSFPELEEKIKACWCSLYEENVLAYNDDSNLYGMNVVVQKMIFPTYAGVVFSIDPTNDVKNYSVMEIVEGLGEQLVSGEKTPSKYLVRRETCRADLKIGDIHLDDNVVSELEKMILKIEEIYGNYVDVEYAICNQDIYILQARPITMLAPISKAYNLTISRPHSLMELDIYFRGEYEGIKNLTNQLYYFKPLFLYNAEHKNVEIYYNQYDLEEDPHFIYQYMDDHFEELKEYYQKVEKIVSEFKICMSEKKEIDASDFLEKIIFLYPFTTLGQLAGHFDAITPRVRELMQNYRNYYDDVCHDACEYLTEVLKKKLPISYLKYINFLRLEEVISSQLPSIPELESRKNGYILFDQFYCTDDYQGWLLEHNICISEEEFDENDVLKGQVSYPGNVTGRVCIVLSEEDFSKFQDGDVLVTPMTIPKFISLIKRCSAIVTDEGGVTCHASIIARELKVPCIVGCRIATKVLKDGDIIEIDGSSGSVKKID